MNAGILRERVISLSAGLSGLCIGAEVYAMTIIELAGLYRLLQRFVDG